MKTIKTILCVVIILNFILFLDFKSASSHEEEGLSSLLPAGNEIDSWEKNLDSEEYQGEDLFFYINGGAEIYHEYGFERVIVQDYKSKNGRSASLEVYKMSNPKSAYGMYTFKSSGKGKLLNVGYGCKLQDYYLNFWKGQYLVTITGFDAEKETIDGLKAIANAVDKKIQIQTIREMPGLYSCLPQENLDTQSVKYFTGNLGLVNSYPFSSSNILNIQEGIKGTYSAGYDIYILKYKDVIESNEAFESAEEGFRAEMRYQDITTNQERIKLEDDSGIRIVIEPYRTFILILLGRKLTDASLIFKNLKSHLN
jgi:hypothetical protein